jgi:hypothetical protein
VDLLCGLGKEAVTLAGHPCFVVWAFVYVYIHVYTTQEHAFTYIYMYTYTYRGFGLACYLQASALESSGLTYLTTLAQ